ncbi:ankyrin-2-like [Saccostrea echinata]|uniref:ankyrin-2-like n=1 Tax=Saccostrea echinata TaxID=191078 RepID=UPI002A81256A|nr:ankyrin-2-like [Saccostrea echinata]
MSSMFNKANAVSCPRSWDEYLEAASKLCPQIDGEYNYICVPNENKTELVQFCFRSGKFPAWQLAEHCPYLHSTGNMNSENCTSFSYGCPRKHYMTREIYKYPACLEINTERGCYIADSNCIYNDCDCKPQTLAVIPTAKGNGVTLSLSVVFGLAFCLLISLFLVYFIYMGRKKRKSRTFKSKQRLEKPREKDDEQYVPLKSNEEGVSYISEQSDVRIQDVKHESKTKYNDLHIACINGNTQLCQHTIQHDPHMLKQVNSEGSNAALCAAQGGSVEILELLAEKGVDLTNKNNIGSNILQIACMNSKLEMCKHIIQHYPHMLKQVNNEGSNSAIYAAQGGNVEILELLAEKGVDLTNKNKIGSNILHIACVSSKLEMCQHIIQHYPHMLKQVNNEGSNAALYAVKGGNVEILELLAEKGVDLTNKNKIGSNILHIACVSSKLEMCQHIIYHYPHMLKQVNNIGWNAALYAAQGGSVEIFELLAEKGVDLTNKNKKCSNILHIACVSSKLEMCKHIIQHYPHMLKQANSDGSNAALCAAQGGNVEILELLAEKGVDMTNKNKIGSNILQIACMNSKLEMCKHIIKHYPDMLIQVNNEGSNAALYVAKGGNVEILELLAEKDVEITNKNKNGSNILHIACLNSKLEMCQHIIHHYPHMLKQVNNIGWNAALYAAQGGSIEILELLAEKDVEITNKNKNGSNILHIACMNSKLEMCKHIIQQYPDMLKQMNAEGWNAALCAAKGGNVEILELLSEKDVDLTNKNKIGSNILHIACMNSKLEMCKHIIQHYSDMLTQINNDKWNAASCAAQGGSIEILELLAENGVDLTNKNKIGSNILHIACVSSKLEMCKHIIQQYPDMLKQVNNEGSNAALYAAQGGSVEILELLAEKGVDLTNKNKIGGNILHIACVSSKLEMCKHIIQHYPHILQEVNNEGWNAALCAAQEGNVEILELLAEKGVDLTNKNKNGSNILHIACVNSKLEMCKHIIQHYSDMLKQVNNEGWNAAFYAAQGGNVEILELIAEKGVDLTNKNKIGSNILHIACMNSKLEMCQHIIQHYPHLLKQVNNEGWNAALCAAQGGSIEILELLAEKGVDLTNKNKNGSNILHISCVSSKLEMCKHIIKHYPDMLQQVNNEGSNAVLYAAQGGNVDILELLKKSVVLKS